MRKLLLGLFLFVAPCFGQGSVADQTAALQKVLWADQVRAGLADVYVDVNVLPFSEMTEPDGKQCGCWGLVFNNETGYHIRIIDANGFPKDYPKKLIPLQQRRVLQHEVLHILFTRYGMPDDVQDKFIEAVLPLMGVK